MLLYLLLLSNCKTTNTNSSQKGLTAKVEIEITKGFVEEVSKNGYDFGFHDPYLNSFLGIYKRSNGKFEAQRMHLGLRFNKETKSYETYAKEKELIQFRNPTESEKEYYSTTHPNSMISTLYGGHCYEIYESDGKMFGFYVDGNRLGSVRLGNTIIKKLKEISLIK